ncbi:MAG: preprotein translocase subunit SecD [Halorientalis sp.]
MNLRDNWRIVLLAVFTVASLLALFAPLVAAGGGGATGLEYGLELSGGTRIRAPLVGMHAQPVEYGNRSLTDLRRNLAADLNVSQTDIGLRPEQRAVELYRENVTEAAFVAALNVNGFDVTAAEVDRGVTQPTRSEVVNILNNKINRVGLTGGSARTTVSATGQAYVVVEVPNANASEVRDLIEDRGQVRLVAHFPVERNGSTVYREVTLLTNDDFTNVGTANPPDRNFDQPYVPVSLKGGPDGGPALNFSNAMQRFGFTGPGVQNCPRTALDNPDTAQGYCLYTVVDDQVVSSFAMSPNLARSIENGDFVRDPTFVLTTRNMSEAQETAVNLKAGALPTRLDIDDRGTTYYLQPALAQEFKLFSLLTGLVAWLAVSLVVFVRYGSPRVALPMLATAAAEVLLLLGFAASVGLALNLSHIAGFIAVIGTGVDDLIIIADEILQEGTVATGRVFQNRFRKAFWVIGAAAATTIIAMSPLTVLSLGDLTGFAIVTIVGVLLGVLVTRPAYGDVLRTLMVRDETTDSEG